MNDVDKKANGEMFLESKERWAPWAWLQMVLLSY